MITLLKQTAMKKLILGFVFAIVSGFGHVFAQDIDINLLSVPGSVAQGQSGYVTVTLCNGDASPIDAVVNKIRPLVSLPSNVVVTTITDGTGGPLTEWSVLSNSANNVRLNNIVPLVNGECYTFRIGFTGTVVSGPGPVTGTIGFNGPQTPGNNTANDNSTSSIAVTAPVTTPPVATDDNAGTTSVPVAITVLTNDTPGSAPIDPTKVLLIDPATNLPSTNVTIPGEGTYVVNTTTGVVTFTPDPALATPKTSTIKYTITDTNGQTSNQATITVNATPLPVTLTVFKVTKEGKIARLNWETTEETNSDHFEIQHSISGKDWNKIGTVDSHGESKVTNVYNFTDSNPANGENLYRLKMIDRDATFAYSRIQSIKFDGLGAPAVSIYPNPSTDKVFIQDVDLAQVKQVSILDMNGRALFSSNKVTTDGINVSKFNSGTYILHITNINGTVSNHKIVIAK